MIESFEMFSEDFKVSKGSVTMKDIRKVIALDEGFEYFLNLNGEVSPVSRDEFLQYSVTKTSLANDSNKRFNIDMKGNEIYGVLSDVDLNVEIPEDSIEGIASDTDLVGTCDSLL